MGSDDEILYTIRKTRKAYVVEYFCSIVLLIIAGIVFFKEISVYFSYGIAGIAVTAFISAEYSRWTNKYMITKSNVSIVSGILKQSKTNVYFYALAFVPDLHIKQSRMQRLLNYGTVSVAVPNNAFYIKDINKPHTVLNIIEKLISKNYEKKE